MNKQLVRVLAVVIGLLGIVGLFVSGHLFKLMNVDIVLDLLRIALAGALLYVGFRRPTPHAVNAMLGFVGVLYIVMGMLGIFSSTLLGILPAGLTEFDLVFHVITGLIAVVAGLRAPHSYVAARQS